MKKKLRLGILGCSSIAERSIIPSILKSNFIELTAVASRDSQKGEKFATQFACKNYTYNELLDLDFIDAVYVSLPVGLHYEWGMKVLESNKHLLLEKTFTDSYDKAEKIIDLARKKNLIAMEALMYVYHPLYQTVITLVQNNAIGKIRQVEAFFGFPDLPENNIRNDKNIGGGATLDALIYPLSFCMGICSSPYESLSYNIIPHENYEIDCRGFVAIHWKEFSAFINYGFGFMYRNSYTVWGDKGYLIADRVFSRPPDLEAEIFIHTDDTVKKIKVPPANHFSLMLEDFNNKILKKNASHLNQGEDILRRMQIISEIYEHAHQSEPDPIKNVEVSVIIPVYNSENIIKNTVSEIENYLLKEYSYEIILVNDGSADGSYDVIKNLAKNSTRIKAINLMRNFGQHNAIMAGLHEAVGDYIALMDDDGQHDPFYIKEMIHEIKKGFDIVYVKYDKKMYGFLKNLGSKFNDIMSTKLLDKPKNLYLSSFKIITQKVKEQIKNYTGPYPYIDGMIFSSTQNVTSIPAKHRGTYKNESTYSLKKLIKLWLNMFTNFSVKPLRTSLFVGFLTGVSSVILMCVLAVLKIVNPDKSPEGWTMLAILILIFGSMQLLCLGLVGEYVGRILLLINKRPQFVVRDKVDHDE